MHQNSHNDGRIWEVPKVKFYKMGPGHVPDVIWPFQAQAAMIVLTVVSFRTYHTKLQLLMRLL